jgi:glucose/mannose-6-phosphate isomerase
MLGVAGRQWQMLEWEPQVATSRNQAKQLALELMGKTVVIYSGNSLGQAADRWKVCINRNAKQLAWRGQLSDEEILGWTKQPVNKIYAVIELRSNLDDEPTRKRFKACQHLLSGVRPAPIIVEPKGETELQQIAYCSALADYVSVYLALLNGLNPAAKGILDKVNRELA